jgi:hypothetical protein
MVMCAIKSFDVIAMCCLQIYWHAHDINWYMTLCQRLYERFVVVVCIRCPLGSACICVCVCVCLMVILCMYIIVDEQVSAIVYLVTLITFLTL